MGSTSKVDQMMQMMVTLLLAVIAIISIPKIVGFIFGDDEEEGAKVNVQAAKKPAIISEQKAMIKQAEPVKDKGKVYIVGQEKALIKVVAIMKAPDSYTLITDYVKNRIESASTKDPYSMTHDNEKYRITKFDPESTKVTKSLIHFDKQKVSAIKSEWRINKAVTVLTAKVCKPNSTHYCFLKISGIPNHKKKGARIGIMKDDGEVRNIDNPFTTSYHHFMSVGGYYHYKNHKLHVKNYGIHNGDVVKVLVDLHYGFISFINMTKSTAKDVCVAAFKIDKGMNYRVVVVLNHITDECQLLDNSDYDASVEAEPTGYDAVGEKKPDKAVKKRDIDISRKKKVLMKGGAVKDEETAGATRRIRRLGVHS